MTEEYPSLPKPTYKHLSADDKAQMDDMMSDKPSAHIREMGDYHHDKASQMEDGLKSKVTMKAYKKLKSPDMADDSNVDAPIDKSMDEDDSSIT